MNYIDRFLMSRKNTLVPACDFSERSSKSVPSDGMRNLRRIFDYQPCEKLSDIQLNPREIDMEALLKAGVKIDPSSFANAFGITDAADLERFNESRSQQLLSYVKEHENEFKEMFKSSKSE